LLGNPSKREWVSEFEVHVGMLENSLLPVKSLMTETELFWGNSDGTSIKQNELWKPTYCRFIRFIPKKWNEHIALRCEVYVSLSFVFFDFYKNFNGSERKCSVIF
jgi:hypothetical protein